MLGKASAHALRLAGMLHLVRSTDECVEAKTMELAMTIVDQLVNETKAFHDAPPEEATVLMQHILSIKGDVTWSRCRDKGNRTIRGMKASDLAAAVRQLAGAGLGTIVKEKPAVVFRSSTNGTG